MMAIRLLIADDQAMVREGLSVLLNAQPDIQVAGQAADGQEAVGKTAELRPDVVLMDVRMPVLNGLEATRLIVGGDEPAPRVLVLTTFDLDEYVYEALRAGASGFLLKDASARQLAEAVRVVAAGDALLSPSVTKRLISAFARMGGPRVRAGGRGRTSPNARPRCSPWLPGACRMPRSPGTWWSPSRPSRPTSAGS